MDLENKTHQRWTVIEGGDDVGFDGYGLFAEISFSGITQRFRYIEPSTFMMGSPDNEKGRYESETSHQVTLTKGYWLADTACTQELWQAVMRDNPASFKESQQNPVEQVSWLDTQEFINKLNQQAPHLQAQLPTEAQWEVACRAGTQTPFNFEGEISLDKVNYRGTWDDYENWGEGAKKETVAVKEYKRNTWGLYQMHGNVWEWC
ncbi:MAG: formylglycine-generating enzyme family protein, partial [Gammaproteobacteria bacterium]|nr:formylglycine-generating enzyme family protein [Gammaproteobacteria bacterium]